MMNLPVIRLTFPDSQQNWRKNQDTFEQYRRTRQELHAKSFLPYIGSASLELLKQVEHVLLRRSSSRTEMARMRSMLSKRDPAGIFSVTANPRPKGVLTVDSSTLSFE